MHLIIVRLSLKYKMMEEQNAPIELTKFEEEKELIFDSPSNLPSLLDDANKSLSKVENPSFSNNAYNLLKQKITNYISELVDESIKNSKREKADVVSASHVEKSSKYLVATNKNKTKQAIGTFGGFLLGGSISNIIGMAIAGTVIPYYVTIILFLIAIIGALMVAWNLFGD